MQIWCFASRIVRGWNGTLCHEVCAWLTYMRLNDLSKKMGGAGIMLLLGVDLSFFSQRSDFFLLLEALWGSASPKICLLHCAVLDGALDQHRGFLEIY